MIDEDDRDRPKITHVAVRFKGVVYSLPKPNRHSDVIALIAEEIGLPVTGTNDNGVGGDDQDGQGFLDASGKYLNRKQALVSAILNDQILDAKDIRAQRLFSENLW